MRGTLWEKLNRAGPIVLIAGAACSTAPRSSPDASVATVPATNPAPVASGRPADAGAPTFEGDAGSPDPLEALHDAEPLPWHTSEAPRPHALKIQLAEENTVVGNLGWDDPHLSDDGAIAVHMENRSSFEAKHALVVLHVVELAHRDRDREMIVVNSPDCRLSRNPPPCDYAGAKASVRKVNVFLARHRWVGLREFSPWTVGFHGSYCGRTLRLRAAGHQLEFRSPRLQVFGPDGALIVDQSDVIPGPAVDAPPQCPAPQDASVNRIGMDPIRRAMYVVFNACRSPECPDSARYLFFRLPKPSK